MFDEGSDGADDLNGSIFSDAHNGINVAVHDAPLSPHHLHPLVAAQVLPNTNDNNDKT